MLHNSRAYCALEWSKIVLSFEPGPSSQQTLDWKSTGVYDILPRMIGASGSPESDIRQRETRIRLLTGAANHILNEKVPSKRR